MKLEVTDNELRIIEAIRTDIGDMLIDGARNSILEAYIALTNGDKYNKNGITYPDYLPNTIDDALRSALEPYIRVFSGAKEEQKRDCVGYAAILAEWLSSGMPEGRFGQHVRDFKFTYFKNLKKHDEETGKIIDHIVYKEDLEAQTC